MAKPENTSQPGVQTFLIAEQVQANLRVKGENNKPFGKEIFNNACVLIQQAVKKEEPRGRDERGFYTTEVFRKKNQDGTTTKMHVECSPYFFAGFSHVSSIRVILDTRVSRSETAVTVLRLTPSGNLTVNNQEATHNTRWLRAAENIVTDIAKRTNRKQSRAQARQ